MLDLPITKKALILIKCENTSVSGRKCYRHKSLSEMNMQKHTIVSRWHTNSAESIVRTCKLNVQIYRRKAKHYVQTNIRTHRLYAFYRVKRHSTLRERGDLNFQQKAVFIPLTFKTNNFYFNKITPKNALYE